MKRNALSLAFLLASLPACHRDRSPHRAAPVAQAAAEQERTIRHHGQGAEEAGLSGSGPAYEDDDDDGGSGSGSGGGKGGNSDGPKYRDPMVYVDGAVRASLAYNELPNIEVYEHDKGEGYVETRMRVCDYFKALGVDCSKIKESHWYGGRGHIAVITGAELRRFKSSLYFKFTKSLAGKPQMEWGANLHTRDRPDMIGNVALYVEKDPPKFDPSVEMLRDANGTYFDGIPYAHDDGKRGVRVNVDGVLVGRIKRNLLEGNVTAVNEGKANEPPRYRLSDFLAAQKVQLDRVQGVDLVVRDERVVRVPAEDVAAVEFTAAKQHHGEMMFYFGKHYVPALAVDVWSKSAAPTRVMRTVTLGANTADRGNQPQSPWTQVHARR